jgi:bacteriorhodopsin
MKRRIDWFNFSLVVFGILFLIFAPYLLGWGLSDYGVSKVGRWINGFLVLFLALLCLGGLYFVGSWILNFVAPKEENRGKKENK